MTERTHSCTVELNNGRYSVEYVMDSGRYVFYGWSISSALKRATALIGGLFEIRYSKEQLEDRRED